MPVQLCAHRGPFPYLLACAIFAWIFVHGPTATADLQDGGDPSPEPNIQVHDPEITLRLNRELVPGSGDMPYITEAKAAVYLAFRDRYPHIDAINTRGLILPGSRTHSMVPMMQIAGDIAPDQLLLNFLSTQIYIDKRLLYPLDEYIERLAGVEIENGHLLSTPEYLERLEQGPGWDEIDYRVPARCWPIIRRHHPDGSGQHVYLFPIETTYTGLEYNRLMFAEFADQGIEDRAPRDWEEMLQWAKIMTDPAKREYGIHVWINNPGPMFANLVYAAGGHVVKQDKNGDWICTLDSDAAVEAGYFWARLRLEKIVRNGKLVCRGVIRATESRSASARRNAMMYVYLSVNDMDMRGDAKGFGPAPAGPAGLHRSEFNARLAGIFSGLSHDKPKRDATWNYIEFFTGREAQQLKIACYIQAGLGPRLPRQAIEQANTEGQYDSVLRRILPKTDAAYRLARNDSVPAPYGKNCASVYDQMRPAIEAIWNNKGVRDAIDTGDAAAAKTIIRGILERGTKRINRAILERLTPTETRTRSTVSWIAIVGVIIGFIFVLKIVFKAFTPEHQRHRGNWQFARYWKAYVLALPALALIAMWMYWPMLKGTAIAFQEYSVLGDSQWVGVQNFATVLFDAQFWYSLGVSLLYTLMFMFFGFCTPIILAFLLNEVPRGSIFFRTVYYLPAVLSGVVVIFLWKTFYAPTGMLNQILNGCVWLLNLLPGVGITLFSEDWLQNPHWALFMCLLPTVWAGMGPGCLIYLAALKTIPEELYDAADMDGAGIRQKIFGVAVPVIKILIMINFIGAMIGAVRGSGSFVLAMTGGGPYNERGGATEVVGLRLFYITFGDLNFGVGAAMSWVIGSILLGFTVFQLKRLANVEFRTATS